MGYKAFLSYSRADDRAANWLHRALDTYRTPRALVGEESTFGPIPPRLHPIFRDRTDMSGGGALSDRIESALGESEALVVLCSPASAQSVWVNQEVERFIALGRGARIFPVILDGEPECGDAARECFPPALRGKGLLAADLRDIKAANGRRIGDGREMGKLKLIAGLLGVPLDRLIQRERRRQRTAFMAMSGAAAMFAIVAAAALWQTFAAQRAAAGVLAEQSAREIQDGNLPRAFELAANGVRDYPLNRDRFLAQLRWLAFATRGSQIIHNGDGLIIDAALSPDQSIAASIAGDHLTVTDLARNITWRETGPEGLLLSAVALGRGLVAIGSTEVDAENFATDGRVHIRRVSDRALIADFPANAFYLTMNEHGEDELTPSGLAARGLAIGADDALLAVCSETSLVVFDIAKQSEIWRAPVDPMIGDTIPFACRFSDDGQHLAHAVLDTISIYDAASGALLTRASAEGGPDDLEGPFFNDIRHYSGASGPDHDFSALPAIFPLCGGDLGMPAFISAVQSDSFDRVSTGDLGGARAFISPYGFLAVQSAAAFAARCAGETEAPAAEDIEWGTIENAGDAFAASIETPTQVLVRNARGAIVSRMNTRGDVAYVALASDGVLLFASTSQGSELWDARQGLLINRMPLIACDFYCNAIGPFGDGTISVTYSGNGGSSAYDFAAPEFDQDVDTLIAALCPRLFGAARTEARPRACR